MSDRVMSGAELKVQMTGLGLTSIWLATQLGVYTRTVIRWYDADQVPAKAVAEIERINAITSREMHRMIYAIGEDAVFYTERSNRDCSELNTLPASWHRALTFRVLEYARSRGINATVAYAHMNYAPT